MKNQRVSRGTNSLPIEIVLIRGLMKTKGITAKTAAERLNTSYSNITKVLTGVLKSRSLTTRLFRMLENI